MVERFAHDADLAGKTGQKFNQNFLSSTFSSPAGAKETENFAFSKGKVYAFYGGSGIPRIGIGEVIDSNHCLKVDDQTFQVFETWKV